MADPTCVCRRGQVSHASYAASLGRVDSTPAHTGTPTAHGPGSPGSRGCVHVCSCSCPRPRPRPRSRSHHVTCPPASRLRCGGVTPSPSTSAISFPVSIRPAYQRAASVPHEVLICIDHLTSSPELVSADLWILSMLLCLGDMDASVNSTQQGLPRLPKARRRRRASARHYDLTACVAYGCLGRILRPAVLVSRDVSAG